MRPRTPRRCWPVSVLVCSSDSFLSDLVARNLGCRRFEVHQAPLAPPDATSVPPGVAIDIVVANLDDEDSDDLGWLRTLFPYQGLVLLVNGWPSRRQLQRLQPCRFVRKPFTIDELLAECEAACPVLS